MEGPSTKLHGGMNGAWWYPEEIPMKCVEGQGPQYKKLGDSLPSDMLLSAMSVLVVAQSISEIPAGLMNNPVYKIYLA
jgi:hypothetical protein